MALARIYPQPIKNVLFFNTFSKDTANTKKLQNIFLLKEKRKEIESLKAFTKNNANIKNSHELPHQ